MEEMRVDGKSGSVKELRKCKSNSVKRNEAREKVSGKEDDPKLVEKDKLRVRSGSNERWRSEGSKTKVREA